MRQLIFSGVLMFILAFVFIIVFTYLSPAVVELNDTIHDMASDVNDTATEEVTDTAIERWNQWPVVALICLLGSFLVGCFIYVRESY